MTSRDKWLRTLLRRHRRHFKLGKTKVNLVSAYLDGVTAYGLCLPHWPPEETREVTLVISAGLEDWCVLPILLHELIHAEQFALDQDIDHGAYFKWRVEELRAAGLEVADHNSMVR